MSSLKKLVVTHETMQRSGYTVCDDIHVDIVPVTLVTDILQHPDESQTSHILSGSHGYQRATSLLITTVNQSDAGTYRCHAYNEKGANTTEVWLDIRGEC